MLAKTVALNRDPEDRLPQRTPAPHQCPVVCFLRYISPCSSPFHPASSSHLQNRNCPSPAVFCIQVQQGLGDQIAFKRRSPMRGRKQPLGGLCSLSSWALGPSYSVAAIQRPGEDAYSKALVLSCSFSAGSRLEVSGSLESADWSGLNRDQEAQA